MAMGRFRSAPHYGHLERVQCICGYLRKRPVGAVRFRVNIPDNSHNAPGEQNWDTTVYGNVTEELPHNMPTPKGKPVHMTTFEDANLLHDHATGRSAMGVLHFVNQTPIEWEVCHRQNCYQTDHRSCFAIRYVCLGSLWTENPGCSATMRVSLNLPQSLNPI